MIRFRVCTLLMNQIFEFVLIVSCAVKVFDSLCWATIMWMYGFHDYSRIIVNEM